MEINEISDAELNNIDQWVQTSMHNDAVHGDILMRMPRLSDAAANVIYDRTKQVAGALVDYRELMMMYTCAMKEIQTKFEVLNSEFNVRYSRNPINSMSTRLKRTVSIVEKLARKGQAFTPENVERYLGDVAGVRVICSYVDDIYKIADSFVQQDDITLIERKDYIANPKENGYRSLHLIVKVPVFFADQKCEMKVEVQLRTIAMDFLASLVHATAVAGENSGHLGAGGAALRHENAVADTANQAGTDCPFNRTFGPCVNVVGIIEGIEVAFFRGVVFFIGGVVVEKGSKLFAGNRVVWTELIGAVAADNLVVACPIYGICIVGVAVDIGKRIA